MAYELYRTLPPPRHRRDDHASRESHDHTRVDASREGAAAVSRRRPCPTQETQITIKYGISTFMSKYFIFALYLPLFQLILDVFILNTQELVFGWKVYDYVSYQRYRFSVRDQRCVAPRCVEVPSRHRRGPNRFIEGPETSSDGHESRSDGESAQTPPPRAGG